MHRFEQFVINSKAKNQKEVFLYAKSSINSYYYLERRKIELKEKIAELEATLKRPRAPGQYTTIRNEDLRKAFEHERMKYIKLNNELKLRSITSPETAFTNKDSLDRLNGKFGLTLTSDAVFRKVLDVLKYPHKYPIFFMQPETVPGVRHIRRRRRI